MMYYEKLLQNIQEALQSGLFEDAEELIENELKAPYIPSDILKKLQEYKKDLPVQTKQFGLSDEEIEKYLFLDEQRQLVAVNALNQKNLRDYFEIVNRYLKEGKSKNAKALLMESLINQEISEEYTYIDNGIEYKFIPRFALLPQESLGFQKTNQMLMDHYMKEPSKYELSKSLLYKKCILYLPLSYEEEEAKILFEEIVAYIEKAFH